LGHHPTAAELERFVSSGLSAERSRAVIVHLLRGCDRCRGKLALHLPGLFGRRDLPEPPALPPEAYDEAVDRAFGTVRGLVADLPAFRTAEQKKREAVALLASRGLEGLADAPPDLQGLPLFEALLEQSWVLRYENPNQMVELARCAALLADKLSESEHDAQEIADLRCRAWIELANAYRVADALDRADEALDRATTHFAQGTQGELLGARFFDVLASQYAARRSFSMACSALDIVAEIYRQHGDEHLAGRALIMKGIFTGYQGDAEAAVRLLQQGLSAVDESRDPKLVVSATQATVRFLLDCGRFRDARRTLWELRRRNPDFGGRLNELKVRWLEGQIFVGLRDLDRAEQALRQVKEGFEETGLPFKAALAGLELGAVWLRQDRFDAATEIVLEATGVFLSLGIEREVLASVLLLKKASELRSLTLALLNPVIASLRELEWEPSAHFYPPAEG
jgi:tetratricopeptide (TPR) repeat protein